MLPRNVGKYLRRHDLAASQKIERLNYEEEEVPNSINIVQSVLARRFYTFKLTEVKIKMDVISRRK